MLPEGEGINIEGGVPGVFSAGQILTYRHVDVFPCAP